MKVMIDLSKVDWNMLKKQKDILVFIRNDYEDVDYPRWDILNGVIHFLDNIQDQVAEQIGEEKVFGKEIK